MNSKATKDQVNPAIKSAAKRATNAGKATRETAITAKVHSTKVLASIGAGVVLGAGIAVAIGSGFWKGMTK